jgi:cytochrome P450
MQHNHEEAPVKDFIPPYPAPNKSKAGMIKRFSKSWNSWIHSLFEKSYTMKVGHVKIFKKEIFMVNEPSLVKKVMVDEWKDFPKHHLLTDVLKPLLGESIFTTNGEVWRKQRDMIDPAFAHTRLEKAFPLMSDAVADMLKRIEAEAKSGKFVVDPEMTHITADIIFRTILSYPLSTQEAHQIFEAFNKFQAVTQKIMVLKSYGFPTFHYRRKSEKAAAEIRPVLGRIIKQRYDDFQSGKDTENRDILSAMMISKDKNTGLPFGYEELVDHVTMLFLAGHETTASSLTWSLYLLASCKHIQDKVREEIKQVTGGEIIRFEHIKKLSYTFDVFSESLRLYPPVGFFMREAAKDNQLKDRKVCKHAMVMVAPWLIHRHKKQWKDAESFKPERFQDEDSKESIKCSYLPFGSGPRICIGKGFANQEAVLILASIVQKFELEAIAGKVPEPVGRVTIRPKDEIELKISTMLGCK